MSDDKNKVGGQDRRRININEDCELRGWSTKFGVTVDELKMAVAAVGGSVERIQAWLRKQS